MVATSTQANGRASGRARGTADEMLRESRHRFTNDMQMVIGMLALQARAAQNEEARAALDDARARIAVLARGRADGDGATVISVLRHVCDALAGVAGPRGVTVRVDTLDAPGANPSTATTVGLIVNELASNAVKHAFANGGGVVTVRAQREGDQLLVVVDDDGSPMPETPPRGLGLELVRRLAASMRGSISMPREGSKAFEVRVPLG